MSSASATSACLALLLGVICSAQIDPGGPPGSSCGPNGLEAFVIPPFPAATPGGPTQMALVFRNCTDRPQQISGVPTVKFFLSEAGAGRLEASGELPIRLAFDYFQPGNPEDEKRRAPVALNPGESAHVLLAYFGRPPAHSVYASVPQTRLSETPDSCYTADVLTHESFPITRAFRAYMRLCGSVYVSEYRRGLPVRGERIRPEFLGTARPDSPGSEVTGPMLASFPLDKQFDIGLRSCEAEDLDIWYTPPDRRVNPAAMIIHFQNIWTHSCVMFYRPGVEFIKGQLYDRANVALEPQQTKPNLILPPSGRAAVTLRFNTSRYPQWACQETSGLMVFRDTIIRWSDPLHICSRVEVTAISPEGFETDEASGADGRVSLKLTSDRTLYYDGERVPLQVRVEGPAESLRVDSRSCVNLVQRSRKPGGSTRYDPILGPASCNASGGEAPGSSRVVEMDFDARHQSGHGEHRIDLAYVPPPEAEGDALFARSNTLHLTIADASLIARIWGPLTKGVAADVTLDFDRYALGQDVSLHVALKDFDSEVKIYGLANECASYVRVEVRHAEGLPFGRLAPKVTRICMGSRSPGVVEYPRGKVVTRELTLRNLGLLPDRPGDYTVTAFWPVYDCQLCAADASPYAVATSGPRPFRIIARP
ncbi:MAG: hypothetical protein JNN08_21915 [Bryobacterales bacterium]|nr:hypothetical protein [Bryobacterales bacterium]